MSDLTKKVEQINQLANNPNGPQDELNSAKKASNAKKKRPAEEFEYEDESKKLKNPFTQPGKRRGKSLTTSFLSRTRDQIFEKNLKDATNGPPVGTYRTQYDAQGRYVTGPVYGTKAKWGGKLAK